jgi:hypothetical protein
MKKKSKSKSHMTNKVSFKKIYVWLLLLFLILLIVFFLSYFDFTKVGLSTQPLQNIEEKLYFWGDNSYGQLGYFSYLESPLYMSKFSLSKDVFTGHGLICSQNNSDNKIDCIGHDYLLDDFFLKLLISFINSRISIGPNLLDLDLGKENNCLVVGNQSGDVYCGSSYYLSKVFGISDALKVSVGDNHICSVLNDGKINCWGCCVY